MSKFKLALLKKIKGHLMNSLPPASANPLPSTYPSNYSNIASNCLDSILILIKKRNLKHAKDFLENFLASGTNKTDFLKNRSQDSWFVTTLENRSVLKNEINVTEDSKSWAFELAIIFDQLEVPLSKELQGMQMALSNSQKKICTHEVSVNDLHSLCQKYKEQGNHQLLRILDPLLTTLLVANPSPASGGAPHTKEG